MQDQASFKKLVWGDAEDNTKKMYWEDTHAQQLMRSIVRLAKWHDYFEPGDIHDDLNDCAECSMSKKNISKLLRKFEDDSLIKKTQNDVRDAPEYQVANKNFLCKFMNPSEGEIPGEEDLQSSSEEERMSNTESDDYSSEEEEDIRITVVNNSDENGSNQSPNPGFDGDKRTNVSSPATIHPGRDGTAAAAISPENLDDGLKRKAPDPVVPESETSKRSKNEISNLEAEAEAEEGRGSFMEALNSEEGKKDNDS